MQKTHWKKLHNPDYIGSYSLSDDTGAYQDLNIRFKSVSKKLIKGPDGKEEECITAEIQGQKPMILNATNCKTLTKLFDSPMVEDWCTKSITLFVAKVRAFGETVDALRVRPEFPKPQELKPGHPKWDGAVKAIKDKSTTIEAIRNNYTITSVNEKLLYATV